MLCVTLKGYTRACAGVTGGLSDAAIFDPNDLNFTQAAAVNGVAGKYTAVALRDDADDDAASVFVINFQVDEGEWTFKQSKNGCATKYEHELVMQLPENSHDLTTFLQALDAAGCCCGIGAFIRLNSGKIFLIGEKYVNNGTIPRFTLSQDGTEGGSGKLFDDFNGGTLHLKANYSRSLYEYTGTWDSVLALTEAAGS